GELLRTDAGDRRAVGTDGNGLQHARGGPRPLAAARYREGYRNVFVALADLRERLETGGLRIDVGADRIFLTDGIVPLAAPSGRRGRSNLVGHGALAALIF